MSTNKWIGLFTLFAGLIAVQAADKAAVKQARTNARGAASLSSEVVIQLEKGEVVTVLEEITVKSPKAGEPTKWLRIQLPADTLVWIHAGFIDAQTKVVIPSKLNVRAGPGEHFSVLCRLDKGATVKPVRTVGEWMEIEAPATASVFVAAELLERENASHIVTVPKIAPTTNTITSVIPPATTNVIISVPITSFVKPPSTNKVDEAFPAPPIPVVPTKAVTPKTNNKKTPPKKDDEPKVVTPTPPTKTVEPAAATTSTNKLPWYKAIFHTEPKPKMVAKKVEAPIIPPTPVVAEVLPIRIVTREGIIQRTLNIQAPAEYVLEHPETGKVINYLHTTNTNVPMKLLKGRRVLVSGQEAIDPRWTDTPLLKIETLRTTDN